jgi:hypothetical protein
MLELVCGQRLASRQIGALLLEAAIADELSVSTIRFNSFSESVPISFTSR